MRSTPSVFTPVSYTHLDVYKRQAETVLKAVTVGKGIPFDDATARETEKAGLQALKLFKQILAEDSGYGILRHHGDMIKFHTAGFFQCDDKKGVCSIFIGAEHCLISIPFLPLTFWSMDAFYF